MVTFPISEKEIDDYFDIISFKATFETLKKIYLQKEEIEIDKIEDLNKKIDFYENSRKRWWTDILNKYNYPYFSGKKTYLSRTNSCIVVE